MRTVTRITLLSLAAAALVLGVQYWGSSGEAQPLVPTHAEVDEGPEATRTVAPGGLVRGTAARERVTATGIEPLATPPDLPPAGSKAPAPYLIIRVVDAKGTPQAGVRLRWVLRIGVGPARRMPVDGQTDQDGLLVIEEEPRWPWLARGVSTNDFVRSVGVRLALPYDAYDSTDEDDAPWTAWRDPDTPAGTVLDVVLPPSGAVRFDWGEVSGSDGLALKDLHLSVRRSDGDHLSLWHEEIRMRPGESGHHFAPVGLGWMVFGELSAHGVEGVLGRVNALGPTLPGEVVTLRIEVGEAHRDLVELTGVAVTEDGSPLGRLRELDYALGSGTAERTARGSITFDERGRWSVQIPRTRLDSPLRLTHRSRGSQQAIVPFDSPDGAQRILDVGTVTFRAAVVAPIALPTPAPTPLARGRVVDAEGAPLKGVSVSAWGRARSLAGAEVPSDHLSRLSTTDTSADGSYALDAVAELMPGPLKITAHHPEFVKAPAREVAPRATDVDFVLTRGATLALVVQVEPALLVGGILRFGLRREDTRHEPMVADGRERARVRDTNPDGFPLRFVGLVSGEHTFVVDLGNPDSPLLELDVVVGGDTNLGTVDIRGRLGVCHLRLSTPGGEPVVAPAVQPRAALTNASVPHHVHTGAHGRLTLLAPLSVGDLVLDCGDAGRAHIPRALLRPVAEVDAPVFTAITVQ